MEHEYVELARNIGLATNDAEATIGMVSRVAIADAQAGDSPEENIYAIPANLDKERIESLGIMLLDELPEDEDDRKETFVRAKFPEGWTVQGRNPRYFHDEKGIRRITTSDNGKSVVTWFLVFAGEKKLSKTSVGIT